MILNGIALFLKSRVFNISWEAEKREIRTFFNSKKIVIKFSFCLCGCFSLRLFPFFPFSQRAPYYFIDKFLP